MRRLYSFLFAIVLCALCVCMPLWGQQFVSSTIAGSPAATQAMITAFASGGVPTADGGTISIGDGGAATAAGLQSPSGVIYYNGYIYILESAGARVRQIDGSGVMTTVGGTGTSGY